MTTVQNQTETPRPQFTIVGDVPDHLDISETPEQKLRIYSHRISEEIFNSDCNGLVCCIGRCVVIVHQMYGYKNVRVIRADTNETILCLDAIEMQIRHGMLTIEGQALDMKSSRERGTVNLRTGEVVSFFTPAAFSLPEDMFTISEDIEFDVD